MKIFISQQILHIVIQIIILQDELSIFYRILIQLEDVSDIITKMYKEISISKALFLHDYPKLRCNYERGK